MSDERTPVGVLTAGSLLDGLEMKLAPGVSVESLRAGQYVVIEGDSHLFYTMITDVRLENASPRIPIRPPGDDEPLLRLVLAGESTYVTVQLRPLLQLPHDDEAALDNAQVKTVPPHFKTAFTASHEDVARVFGDPESDDRFHIGTPLDMDAPVCLDLGRFVERSNGIFGKTGTGKTFLTRLVLAGLLLKCKQEVVSLVFDMHNEYGNSARQEGSNVQVPGLRELFPGRVAVYTLDEASTRRRGGSLDGKIQLAYADIEPSDIYAMRQELSLSEAMCDHIGLLARQFGGQWLPKLLHGSLDELAEELHAHPGSLQALARKLQRLTSLSFLHRTLPDSAPPTTKMIVERLANQDPAKRQHVILEFGNTSGLLAYLLVANVLTRKIHREWIERSEQYHATQLAQDKPPHLVIVVEEAHKFLNTEAARQTSFGEIARELRKYFVSLLIVDQRPSGIDDEILSQLGTRITAQLNDDRDLQAVLAGTTNSGGLRVVLAGLDSKQQALVFGHAVPMPVVLKTRHYDEGVATVRRQLEEDTRATMDRSRRGPTEW